MFWYVVMSWYDVPGHYDVPEHYDVSEHCDVSERYDVPGHYDVPVIMEETHDVHWTGTHHILHVGIFYILCRSGTVPGPGEP